MTKEISSLEVSISSEFKLTSEGEDLLDRLGKIDGTHNVPVKELFSTEFMKAHSNFPDFEAMIKASGFEKQILENFSKVPEDRWKAYVRKNTQFSGWEEMKNTAAEEWIKKQLGL